MRKANLSAMTVTTQKHFEDGEHGDGGSDGDMEEPKGKKTKATNSGASLIGQRPVVWIYKYLFLMKDRD